MDLLCVSCRRRILHHSLKQLCALRGRLGTASRHQLRLIHLSQMQLDLNKPQPTAVEEDVNHDVIAHRKIERIGEPSLASLDDQDEQAIKEHYHDNQQAAASEAADTVVEEEWREDKLSLKQLPKMYLKLSKSRLTALVVLTTLAGYSMAPGSINLTTLLWATAGTGLCSAAANTFNQWIEVPYDSQMTRTRNRVLVRGMLSPLHAALFGLTSGLLGANILYHMVNPLTAALGVTNMLLYTMAYTPLKRISIINTWVGSVVGSIPPLMGWAACAGSLDPGALVLAGILYTWQFAHFNALSWGLRGDYSRAGYRMMAVTDPGLCKRVALRYSLATIPVCFMAPACDMTTWWFALDSLPVNLWLSFLAWRFYKDSDFRSSRRLFQFSLFHLPLLMGLLLVNKKRWYWKEEDSVINEGREIVESQTTEAHL